MALLKTGSLVLRNRPFACNGIRIMIHLEPNRNAGRFSSAWPGQPFASMPRVGLFPLKTSPTLWPNNARTSKTVRYRKDVPQHRMYFHEYTAPDKIPYKVRQIFDWLNGPEPKKLKSALRIAAKVHYDLLRVFPFAKDSGKVVRLFTNMLLLRADYPPAILHSTERQRYYEALKGSSTTMHAIVQDAIENSLSSIEKLLDLYDGKAS